MLAKFLTIVARLGVSLCLAVLALLALLSTVVMFHDNYEPAFGGKFIAYLLPCSALAGSVWVAVETIRAQTDLPSRSRFGRAALVTAALLVACAGYLVSFDY